MPAVVFFFARRHNGVATAPFACLERPRWFDRDVMATQEAPVPRSTAWFSTEDWWAIWLGCALLLAAGAGWLVRVPPPAIWEYPTELFQSFHLGPLLWMTLWLAGVSAVALRALGVSWQSYLPGFCVVAMLAIAARAFEAQATVRALGGEAALFALGLGLLVANTVGTPSWVLRGARSELFIKVGLVLMGVEILAPRMWALGGPGFFLAWGVTPIVILTMWWFGTRVLKMSQKRLVMVISCATSVCGVSAAIATSAACRAKKEELTLAVGISMIFTVAMMIGLPALCRLLGLDELVGGAWIGGTVDSTGAVVAAGALLGPKAEEVAAVVKMIQNTLIGLVSFVVAVYWVTRVEVDAHAPRPSLGEVWRRFPKFVIGFVGASLLASFVLLPSLGEERLAAITSVTKDIKGWWFALAFTSIGLESNFRALASQLVGGKPIVLYLVGQSWNILLTLAAAYVLFSS